MDRTNLERLKPFALGIVGGFVLFPIVAFGADWVVTTATLNERLTTTRTNLLATVCALEAKDLWFAMQDRPELEGWDNREARETLAKKAVIVLPDKESADPDVVDECADRIEDVVAS